MYNVRSAVCARISLCRSRQGCGGGSFEAKSMQRDTLRHDIPGELLCDLATRQKVHVACKMFVQLSVRVSLFGAAGTAATAAAALKPRACNVTHCDTIYLASFFATWRRAKRCTQHVQCWFKCLCVSLSLASHPKNKAFAYGTEAGSGSHLANQEA